MLPSETTDKQPKKECFSVYCHTNVITNKRYVGYTKFSPEERWNQHCRCALKKNIQNLFYAAIRKFGNADEIWKHEILETFTSKEDALRAEQKWIAFLKTNGLREGHVGYNMTDGGEGLEFNHHTHEIKAKISKSLQGNENGKGNKGRVWTVEQRQQIGATLKGRTRSESEREKISQALRNRARKPETFQKISKRLMKPVTQLNDNNEIIQQFKSIGLVVKEFGCSYKVIRDCCNQKRKTFAGFIWRWA